MGMMLFFQWKTGNFSLKEPVSRWEISEPLFNIITIMLSTAESVSGQKEAVSKQWKTALLYSKIHSQTAVLLSQI
jgi:hypothetical protein